MDLSLSPAGVTRLFKVLTCLSRIGHDGGDSSALTVTCSRSNGLTLCALNGSRSAHAKVEIKPDSPVFTKFKFLASSNSSTSGDVKAESSKSAKGKAKAKATADNGGNETFTIAVSAKALLGALRNRGAGGAAAARKRELERCQIYLHPEAIREYHAGPASDNDDDDEDGSEEEEDELASASTSQSKSRRGKHPSGGGEGAAPIERLVITLYHSHGMTKTHRLTFSLSESLLPVLDLSSYSCSFSASASLLRAWMDHFHLKPGSGAGHQGGGTHEVSLYCEEEALTIKSFASFDAGAEEDGAHILCPSSQLASVAESGARSCCTELPNVSDIISHRPLFTEVMVDVGDFELWSISGMPIITFALKEFKVRVSSLLWLSALFTDTEESLLSSAQAIVALATELNVTLDAHFDEGGKPLVIDFVDDRTLGSAVTFARAQGETPSPAFVGQYVVATTAYDSRTPETSASSTAAAAVTKTKAYGDSKVFDKFKKKKRLSSASSSKAASSAARTASSQQQQRDEAPSSTRALSGSPAARARAADHQGAQRSLAPRHPTSLLGGRRPPAPAHGQVSPTWREWPVLLAHAASLSARISPTTLSPGPWAEPEQNKALSRTATDDHGCLPPRCDSLLARCASATVCCSVVLAKSRRHPSAEGRAMRARTPFHPQTIILAAPRDGASRTSRGSSVGDALDPSSTTPASSPPTFAVSPGASFFREERGLV